MEVTAGALVSVPLNGVIWSKLHNPDWMCCTWTKTWFLKEVKFDWSKDFRSSSKESCKAWSSYALRSLSARHCKYKCNSKKKTLFENSDSNFSSVLYVMVWNCPSNARPSKIGGIIKTSLNLWTSSKTSRTTYIIVPWFGASAMWGRWQVQ